MIAAMHEDETRLNVLRPDVEPRATDHIAGMHTMIQTLIDKGFAYAPGNGDVLPGRQVRRLWQIVASQDRRPEDRCSYRSGRSQGRSAGLRIVEGRQAGRAELGFAVGPWASRLAYRVFGDVHLLPGRDVRHPWWRPDLVFPHHENEIAQSEAATGKLYANAWMHAGAVRVDGEKMSRAWAISSPSAKCWRSTTRRWCATCWYPATTAARSTTPKTVCVKPRALWSVSTTASGLAGGPACWRR